MYNSFDNILLYFIPPFCVYVVCAWVASIWCFKKGLYPFKARQRGFVLAATFGDLVYLGTQVVVFYNEHGLEKKVCMDAAIIPSALLLTYLSHFCRIILLRIHYKLQKLQLAVYQVSAGATGSRRGSMAGDGNQEDDGLIEKRGKAEDKMISFYQRNLKWIKSPALFIGLFVLSGAIFAYCLAVILNEGCAGIPKTYGLAITAATISPIILGLGLISLHMNKIQDNFYIKAELTAVVLGLITSVSLLKGLQSYGFKHMTKGDKDAADTPEAYYGIYVALWSVNIRVAASLTMPLVVSYRFYKSINEVDGGQGKLKKYLKSAKNMEKFEAFTLKELSSENLLFWRSVRDWKKTCQKKRYNLKQLYGECTDIHKTYLTHNSPREINLPSSVFASIQEGMVELQKRYEGKELEKSDELFNTIYDEAFLNIEHLMENDSWKRYCQEQVDKTVMGKNTASAYSSQGSVDGFDQSRLSTVSRVSRV